jgi:DNA-binding response OmpR family regulator
MPKILIVDDDPIIRNLLLQILEPFEELGVELLNAGDGKAALDIIKKSEPEIVFLDVMMPNINGFEVCKITKNEYMLKNIYIIMLTAKGQEVDRQKAIDCGADHYITKPFNIDEILKKVSAVLGMNVP